MYVLLHWGRAAHNYYCTDQLPYSDTRSGPPALLHLVSTDETTALRFCAGPARFSVTF